MRILITGGSGFVGRNTFNILKDNYEIFEIGRRNLNNNKNFVKFNFLSLIEFENRLVQINPDIIINLVASVSFAKKRKDMNFVNTKIPKSLAKYCKKYDKYLIHLSGTLVHGIKNNYSIRTGLCPQNHYAKTKLKGDQNIVKSNCNFCILRLPGIYGYDGPDHLGLNNLIKSSLIQSKEEFNGNINSKRNYIFIKDLIKEIVKIIKKTPQGIIYIGGQTLTFKKMIALLNKNNSFDCQIKVKKNKQKVNHQLIIPNRKISFTSFKKSLKIIINEHRLSL